MSDLVTDMPSNTIVQADPYSLFPLEPLLGRVKAYNPSFDQDLIVRAYHTAYRVHEGITRKSGEPYFVHLYAVASILVDLQMDTATIAAGFLHDTVEDTPTTLEEIEEQFGPDIRLLVYGVTKIGQYKYRDDEGKQAENFSNLVMASASDIRVIIIKLADRLHNMRTLNHVPPHKQTRIARETLLIFAPFANRLGMSRLKVELEDLCFRYLEPEAYNEINRKLQRTEEVRERLIVQVQDELQAQLERRGIVCRVTARPKHLFSIHSKMQSKKLTFEQIHDIIGVRVIVDDIKDCYSVLGIVHSLWRPHLGRLKDYIGMPKPNMYQSIHTTVSGPDSHPMEVQIRTEEMHRVAEQGIAAHWVYKERGKNVSDATKKFFDFVRQFAVLHEDCADVREFFRESVDNLLSESVFVLTPKGDVRSLPKGATPVDFAYEIHTEVGNTCVGARANGHLVTLNYVLRHGDVVEIMTVKTQRPRADWLRFVKTYKAKSKIQSYIKSQEAAQNIEAGRDLLLRELRPMHIDLRDVLKHPKFETVLSKFSTATPDDLFAMLAAGGISKQRLVSRLKSMGIIVDPREPRQELKDGPTLAKPRDREEEALTVGGITDVLNRFAKCCLPVYGDPITGVVTRGRGVSVHVADCPNLSSTREKMPTVTVAWGDHRKRRFYETRIQVIAKNRMGLAGDINSAISNTGTNMTASKMESLKGELARGEMTVEVSDLEHLDRLLAAVKSVKGVVSAGRG